MTLLAKNRNHALQETIIQRHHLAIPSLTQPLPWLAIENGSLWIQGTPLRLDGRQEKLVSSEIHVNELPTVTATRVRDRHATPVVRNVPHSTRHDLSTEDVVDKEGNEKTVPG